MQRKRQAHHPRLTVVEVAAGTPSAGGASADPQRQTGIPGRDRVKRRAPPLIDPLGQRHGLATRDSPGLFVPNHDDVLTRQRGRQRQQVERLDAAARAVAQQQYRARIVRR